MEIIKIPPVGVFAVNCYLVVSEAGNAVMIDCPEGAERLLDEVKKSGAVLKKILLTHGHCDHIESLAEVAEATGAEVYIHKFDASKLTDSRGNLSEFFAAYYDEPIKQYSGAETVSDGDIIVQDELEFKVLHTPGHTSGCVCYIIGDVMFSGDTLFRGSIGRTDMVDSDFETLSVSLKRLTEITENYRVLPGHGGETTLDREKNHNPYIGGNMFAF